MVIRSRPFANEDDYAQMRELLMAGFAVCEPPVYCTVGYTIGDLDWWRYTANPGAGVENAQLWFIDDALAAFTWPTHGELDLLVHPEHQQFLGRMLDWSFEQARARTADDADHSELRVWSFDGDLERVRLYQERSLHRTDTAMCSRRRSLAGAIPEPALPDGYRIRQVAGEQDLEQRVEVHRNAFTPSKMTVEKHRNVMQSATYRPDLDLVVEALDGTFAAYCLVWFDEHNHLGIFEPVGCHSDYRRRGLTKAVMYEGMRRLQALGATVAFVNNTRGAEAASALYDSVGMRVLDETHAWVKTFERCGSSSNNHCVENREPD